ncbi:hypothetical protein [Bradyrhizobium sp. Ash2021]|uniref:hypothetical protein n=1 Tax=Bradyrhizobium sp. Ash2021 TaxID=2954771 RepID=UPI0028150615|nr:hypothetical protein [Bradyrhizobium sp. Ash2021]WMT71909.1 hypothetical protein NL528_28015 [Bradyrhizobium sp. Ash2021]
MSDVIAPKQSKAKPNRRSTIMTTTINTSMPVEVRELTTDELNRVSGGMDCQVGYSVCILNINGFKIPILASAVDCKVGPPSL